MKTYGQYCPISRAAEILGDRWTLHIVRDLMTGADRFNELARGNPGLSRALLTRRLQQLQRAGLVEHHADGSYRLTAAGRDLQPLIFGMANWAARWAFGEPSQDELDPDLLMWWLHRRLDAQAIAARRFTIGVQFTDLPKRYWIVVEDDASLCLVDPGFEVDVLLVSDRRALYRTYLGHQTFDQAHRSGEIELVGSLGSVRRCLAALNPSPVADIVAAAGR